MPSTAALRANDRLRTLDDGDMREGSLALLLALEHAGLAGFHVERAPARVTVRALVHHAARLTGQHAAEITGPRRHDGLTRPRHAVVIVALWNAEAEGYDLSLPTIGRAMGGRDHSTVINSRERARALIPRDPEFAWMVERLWAAAECDPFPDDASEPEIVLPPAPEPTCDVARPPAAPKVKTEPGEYVPRHALPPVLAVVDDWLDDDEEQDTRALVAGSSALLMALRREHPAMCIA